MLDRITKFFCSLRLTIVLLGFAILLVFFGTLAQVDEGLYAAQARWFRSFFVLNAHLGKLYIPIFPGGYLIGGLLLINLISAHIERFTFKWRKSGILLVHFGLILLLLGQLLTDLFARESSMRLNVGETRNYSEDFHANELAVTDTSNPDEDTVVAIPESLVARKGEISNPNLPVMVRVKNYWLNADLIQRPPEEAKPTGATHGSLANYVLLPLSTAADGSRAAALIELVGDSGSLGTWLIASRTDEPERIKVGDRQWTVSLMFAPMMGGNFLMISEPGRRQEDQPSPIGESELKSGKEISSDKLPFKIRVKNFWPQCKLFRGPSERAVAPQITQGNFKDLIVEPQPPVTSTEMRNMPAAVVELVSPKGSLGTWLVTTMANGPQNFQVDGKSYEIGMRFMRHYKPFSITLLNAIHKKYPGTEKPKDFRSRVRVQRNDTGDSRETDIYMNAPLRFAGYTFFQYQMDPNQAATMDGGPQWSAFQVVSNPGWLTPYISCILVGLGLVVQFMTHLIGFVMKWRPA
jgi:hypothetical protein